MARGRNGRLAIMGQCPGGALGIGNGRACRDAMFPKAGDQGLQHRLLATKKMRTSGGIQDQRATRCLAHQW